MNYRPQADSLAQRVCHFLANNLEEELTVEDICTKFDTGRANVHTQLLRAKDAGFLARDFNDDGEYVYRAGEHISKIDTPAESVVPLAAKPKRQSIPRPSVSLPMPDLDNIELDNDIALLEPKRREIKHDFRPKLSTLLVGQSFKLDAAFVHVVTSQISKMHKQGEARYRCISLDGNTIRVGRAS